MNNQNISLISSEKEIKCVLLVAEKVFSIRKLKDEKYKEGRKALDKCWMWVKGSEVSGDDLYELIDNEECTGISEYDSEEEADDMRYMWQLLTDAFSFISWNAYKKAGEKYLPQALEGIHKEDIEVFNRNVLDLGLLKEADLKEILKEIS
ncbi:MAG: Imm6 family immunity protein [Sarcina sp.]